MRPDANGALTVTGMLAPTVAEHAARAQIVIHELTPQRASLEEAFLELTADGQEFSAHTPTGATCHADFGERSRS